MTRPFRNLILVLVLGAALACLPTAAVAQDHAKETHAPAAAAAPQDTHAADSHAADGHKKATVIPSPKEALIPAITSLVVFVIVLGILGKFAWPKINKGLDERANKIREEIAAAEAARQKAKAALESYEKSLAEAHAEAQKMLEKTRAQQQALADELKVKADAELSAMRERARQDIEAAKKAALQEISAKTITAATAIASKILRREVNAADQKRLMEDSMGELAAMKS